MAPLTETQRFEALITVHYGDRIRKQQEEYNLFDIK